MTETIPWLVQIWYRDDSGQWRFNGNGVLVDNKSVLTCKHVIETHEEGLPAPPEDLEVRVGSELNKNIVCDVVRSESEDLALLRLEQVVPARLPDFCTDVQKTDVLGVRAWQSRGKAVELQAGESIQCTEVVRDRLWYFDNGIPGGFSGSPLLLDSKRRTTIVGVIEQGGKGKVKSAVIPPSLVCEFLESQDVPVRKKARWFWLARNILVSTVLLLATLGFLLSQTLGKRGLLIGAAVSGLALAASVWVAAAAQKGERTSDHLLYPFLRWLDERKIALMVAAAFCLMIEPALLGWWKFMHEPKVVTLNIVSAAKNTSSWVTNKLNVRRAPARELARAIPASTELDVVLLGNVTPSSAKANSNYQGRVVNDALVQDGQGAVVPKGTPVTVRAVADGSSVRFELTQISLNGTSFNTVSSAGTNRETGAIMEVSVVERGRVSGGVSHAKIGGVAGWFTGLAMGHKGKRIQTATQMSSIGAQIGSKLGADSSTIQTVDSIPTSQVLAFRLSQPVDLKP